MKAKLFLLILFAGFLNTVSVAASPDSLKNDREDIYRKAVQYFQNENYPLALKLFQHLLIQSSDNIEINYYMGMCYYNLQKPKLAKWHFSIAARDNYCPLKILLFARINGEDEILTN